MWNPNEEEYTNLLIVPKRISGAGIPVHDEKSLDTPARMHQFPFDLSLHPIKKWMPAIIIINIDSLPPSIE